jgi:hypothetical protein
MKKDKPVFLPPVDSKPSEPDAKSKAMATLMLDRQERMERCGKVIDEVLKKERCVMFAPIRVTEDGRIVAPSIQVNALD